MSAAPPARIAAACFDLDDTLYPQAAWLDGAWDAVAARAAASGVDRVRLRAALAAVAAEGSDRGRIIDRALAAIEVEGIDVGPLVDAFRDHRPAVLTPYPGVPEALGDLAEAIPLALVSDGDPSIQRAKLDALGLGEHFSVVVWSDEHGREHRKPDPLPFRLALEGLRCDAREAVSVGDRPEKDVAGAVAIGMHAVRVRTGEWSGHADDERAWASVDSVAEACALLAPHVVGAQVATTPASTRNSNRPGARR